MQDNLIFFDVYIRHAWHRISRMYNQKAAEAGITMSVGFILMNVDREGTPSTQLGPKMGMEPTSLSRTLKSMEEKGWILRKEDDFDKRKAIVYLTPSGVEKRKVVKEFLVDFNQKLLKNIPQTKMKAFIEVMGHIDSAIEKELIEHTTNYTS